MIITLALLVYFAVGQENRGVTSWSLGTGRPPFPVATHPQKPAAHWGILRAPLPTNQGWGSVVFGNGDNLVAAWPYIYEADGTSLTMNFGKLVPSNTYVLAGTDRDFIFSCREGVTRRLVDFDLGSYTLMWRSSWASSQFKGVESNAPQNKPAVQYGVQDGAMMAHIVYGQAYTTVKYGRMTPLFKFPIGLYTVNGAQASGQVTGEKFVLNIASKTYVIYCLNGPITFSVTGQNMTATAAYTGVIRVAYCNNANEVAVFDRYFRRYPIACNVSYTVSGDTATYSFNWITEGTGDMLMFALPHQNEIIRAPQYAGIEFTGLRGKMRGLVGTRWDMVEQLTTVGFDGKRAIDSNKLADVKAAVSAEVNYRPGYAGDTYWFGKQVARDARLARIAAVVGDTNAKNEFINRIRTQMTPWMEATNANAFRYDETWGGIVSVNGLKDSGAEYGQGYYNDHHFHYGYFVYAAAVLALEDPTWARKYQAHVEALIRDFANPSNADQQFPLTRAKDWYGGHSWANGLFAFRDGKNQESTSESINGYYAVYLWGLAMNNTDLANWGRLLTATEIRSTKWYWHMADPTKEAVYPDQFARNTCVGILWSTKVDYATWFGGNPEYIHGIQMLPITPICEDYLTRDWLIKEWDVVKGSGFSQEWGGLLLCAHAAVDKEYSWNIVKGYANFDSGNSKANSLYYIATRP